MTGEEMARIMRVVGERFGDGKPFTASRLARAAEAAICDATTCLERGVARGALSRSGRVRFVDRNGAPVNEPAIRYRCRGTRELALNRLVVF
jgi:hypothetical protein